jgi:glyoxylase-like metal-dependent hydrolase (beta-lactamase superfamily II)
MGILAAVACIDGRPRTEAGGGALQAHDSLPPLAVSQLARGVYAVPGDSGRGSEGRPNVGFVVTDEGVVVVDALASPLQGRRLVAAIRSVTERPIRWLILTHHHPDHHFGAVALRRAGARVLAHPDRTTLVAEAGEQPLIEDWTRVVGEAQMRGFEMANDPDVSVDSDTTLALGGREIVIVAPGPAHTPGDLVVWLPGERILFAGDLLIEDGVTMVVDGDSGVLLEALERMERLRPDVVVPGHGRISQDPPPLLALTRTYLEGVRETMRRAVAEGQSMNRLLASLPPPDEGRPVSRRSRERRNAVSVYLEMERAALGMDAAR